MDVLALLRISWREKRINEWVLNKAETERQLLESIRKRKLTYFGHNMMRKKEESLEKGIIQRNMPGGKARGRRKMRWMDNTRSWTVLARNELLRLVENRQRWRNAVQNASNPRIEDA